MTKQSNGLTKQALDSDAARYWEEYYSDSGYGKQWTKNIPKRVKAALDQSIAKAASTGPQPSPALQPLATVITDEGVSLEGLAVYAASAQTPRVVKAFSVDFDHEGQITSFIVRNVPVGA